MPFIDKQGFIHFFKWKINIIDLIVVIFIVGLTPMFWFGYKIFWRKPFNPTIITIPISEYEQLKIINAKVKDFCREHKRASICK